MHPADSPAPTSPSGTPRPNQTTSTPSTATAAPLNLAELVATSAQRRVTRSAGDRPADWADPDASAALALPARTHPVTRTIAQRKSKASQRDEAATIRRACSRLQGLEKDVVTAEQALAYPWHLLTPDEAEEFRLDVYRRYSNQGTRNYYVCVLRSIVRNCYRAGLISPLRRDLILENLFTSAPGRSTKRRRLSEDEVAALLHACETVGSLRARHRNTAIVALMRTTGMRVSEVVALDVSDWDRAEGTLLLRNTKNKRSHTVFVHPATNVYLTRWIKTRGDQQGALFAAVSGTSAHHLHTFAIRYMLKKRGEAAGLRPFGSHDFRRTFATELLRTHDHALVSRLLNHEKLSSTLVYDMVEDDLQRAAVETVRLFADPNDDEDGAAGVLV